MTTVAFVNISCGKMLNFGIRTSSTDTVNFIYLEVEVQLKLLISQSKLL